MIQQFTCDHVEDLAAELNPDVVAAICYTCLVRASSPPQFLGGVAEHVSLYHP